jgi:hypothetical protein
VRALRHLSLWLAGDRSDEHIINASMRCMMARVMEREEAVNLAISQTLMKQRAGVKC